MIIINIQQTANKIETRIVSSDKLNSQNMSYVYINSDNQIYVREGMLRNDIDILSAVLMQRKVDSRIKKTYFDIVDSLKTNQVSKNQFESLYKMVLVLMNIGDPLDPLKHSISTRKRSNPLNFDFRGVAITPLRISGVTKLSD